MRLTVYLIIVQILLLQTGCKTGKEGTENHAAGLAFAIPEQVGLNADSLEKIDDLFQRYVDNQWIPGAVALVARNGKIVYETAVGYSDVAAGEPLEVDDIFRLASMTKPFTSVAAMQLLEQGKLDPADKLSKYIPEFANPRVLSSFNASDSSWVDRPARREISIHDLLIHSSGISYGFTDPKMSAIYSIHKIPDMATPMDFSLEEKIALLGTLPLLHDPGEKHTYGLSTDVLGRVIEVASGMSLSDYIAKNITGPLGLNRTHFFLPDSLHDFLVSAYIANTDSSIMLIGDFGGDLYDPDYPISGAGTYYSGGSGLSGSARDYYLFCQSLLDISQGRNASILGDTSLSIMLSNQLGNIPYWPGKTIGYGFEILTGPNEDMKQLTGRYSWFGAFQTMFWVDPQRDMIAIMLSQVMFSPLVFDFFIDFEKLVNNAVMDKTKNEGPPFETALRLDLTIL